MVCVSSLLRLIVPPIALLALPACEPQRGFSQRDAEAERARIATQPFHVVSASHQRAVVSARGRQVAIVAADGFCVAQESLETSGRSAFALIGDCVLESAASQKGSLPDGVPGIITVSISGDQGYRSDGEGAGSLSDLSTFLDSTEGRSMLGRGGSATSVKIEESRNIDGGLYVLVEDRNDQVVPILAPLFWRAFIDLNGRLTVVTISGFRANPMGQDEMLKHLVAQVKTLAEANRAPLNEPITVLASARPDGPERTSEAETVQALADLEPEGVTITAERDLGDVSSPLPETRPESAEADAATGTSEGEQARALEAPTEVEPSIRTEIAAAAGAVPLPTRAPNRAPADSPAPPVADAASDEAETVIASAGQAAQSAAAAAAETTEVAASTTVSAPEQTTAPSAEPGDGPDVPTTADGAAILETADVAPSSSAASAAQSTDAPAASEAGNAAGDNEAQQAVKDPGDAPTASAPQSAPKAPKRPRQG